MSAFSDFIRNGSEEEKERVFNKVIQDSINDQRRYMYERSKCCGAPVTVAGGYPDYGYVATSFYLCSECQNPCDVTTIREDEFNNQ